MTREKAIRLLTTKRAQPSTDYQMAEVYTMAIQALSQEPCERFEWGIDGNVYKITKAKDGKEICQQVCKYAISRDDRLLDLANAIESDDSGYWTNKRISSALRNIPPVTQKSETVTEFADRCRECGARYGKLLEQKLGKWIPVSKRLPEDYNAVNITWVNHNPKEYYADVKDKPFTATGRYCNGQWWWDSVVCGDYLDEYGHSDCDAMDEYIEVIAWTPLPEPYEPQESEE